MKYGNYTEDQIINNLNRNKSRLKRLRPKSKNKGKQEEAAKDEQDYNINSINEDIGLISTGVPHTTVEGIEIKTKSKKRKFGESIHLSSNAKLDKQIILVTYNNLMKEYCELGNGMPMTEKEKEIFIKKIIPSIKPIETSDKEAYQEFIQVFASQLNIEEKEFSILLEYEIFKSKIEGLFSTLSKLVNQFVLCLSDNNIRDFTNIKAVIEKSPEIKDKYDGVVYRLVSYSKIYNDYFGKNHSKQNQINEVLEKYIPGIEERNEEYLGKISSKLNELFGKYKIVYSAESISNYIKESIDKTANNEKVNSDSELDINNAGINIGVDKFLLPQYEKEKNISETNNKKSKKNGNENKKEISTSKEKEVKNENDNNGAKKSKKKSKNKCDYSVTDYKIQKVPLLSHSFYTCEFSSSHFIEQP